MAPSSPFMAALISHSMADFYFPHAFPVGKGAAVMGHGESISFSAAFYNISRLWKYPLLHRDPIHSRAPAPHRLRAVCISPLS